MKQPSTADIISFVGPVYIKFNTQRKSHYLDSTQESIGEYWCPANPCRTNQSTEPTVIYRSTYFVS